LSRFGASAWTTHVGGPATTAATTTGYQQRFAAQQLGSATAAPTVAAFAGAPAAAAAAELRVQSGSAADCEFSRDVRTGPASAAGGARAVLTRPAEGFHRDRRHARRELEFRFTAGFQRLGFRKRARAEPEGPHGHQCQQNTQPRKQSLKPH
jgi:hypothetical protein